MSRRLSVLAASFAVVAAMGARPVAAQPPAAYQCAAGLLEAGGGYNHNGRYRACDARWRIAALRRILEVATPPPTPEFRSCIEEEIAAEKRFAAHVEAQGNSLNLYAPDVPILGTHCWARFESERERLQFKMTMAEFCSGVQFTLANAGNVECRPSVRVSPGDTVRVIEFPTREQREVQEADRRLAAEETSRLEARAREDSLRYQEARRQADLNAQSFMAEAERRQANAVEAASAGILDALGNSGDRAPSQKSSVVVGGQEPWARPDRQPQQSFGSWLANFAAGQLADELPPGPINRALDEIVDLALPDADASEPHSAGSIIRGFVAERARSFMSDWLYEQSVERGAVKTGDPVLDQAERVFSAARLHNLSFGLRQYMEGVAEEGSKAPTMALDAILKEMP